MKLLLHIGIPKTGSTSIQGYLAKESDTLEKNSIIYPEAAHAEFGGSRILDAIREPETAGRDDRESIDRHLAKIAKTHTDPKVIISSEYLINIYRHCDLLKEFLDAHFEGAKIIMYVREPCAFYKSIILQALKAEAVFPAPDKFKHEYRASIEHIERHFPDCLNLRIFNRERLLQGNIVYDFVKSFLPEQDIEASEFSEASLNVTPAPETLYLMQRYFRQNHRDEPRQFRREAWALFHIFNHTARLEGLPTESNLKPGIRELIISRHSDDLIWMKEQKDIRFSGIEYERISDLATATNDDDFQSLSDVMEINFDAAEKVLQRSLQNLAMRTKDQILKTPG
ncbi:MAG: hypothetical protein AAF950_10625 [Pseudomonadota bacterium]